MLAVAKGADADEAARRPAPCLAWDAQAAARGEPERCLAALLLGAGCCADGSCVLCETVARRMAAAGFSERAIALSMVTTWYTHVEACPVCGFPPPPPLRELQPLPRFVRVQGRKLASSRCPCGAALAEGRRRFCSEEHSLLYRRDAESSRSSSAVPRVFKVS